MEGSNNSAADLVIFEPYSGGHRAEYVLHLLNAWKSAGREERIVLAGPGVLLRDLDALSPGIANDPTNRLSSFELPEHSHHGSTLQLSITNWQLLKQVIARFQPIQVFAMYLDHLQLALALGNRFKQNVTISGILFRASIHDKTISANSLREKVVHGGKAVLLRGMAMNDDLGFVFSLNPLAVPSLRKLGLNAVSIPDPVDATETGATKEDVRKAFDIEPERKLFLLFGVLDRRKGIYQLLDSLKLLTPAESKSIAVLFAGPISDAAKPVVRENVAFLRENSELQLVVHDARIPVGDVQSIIGAADVVLAPYVGHMGSSAVLVRAAAAGTPVLSTDSDLMGSNVKDYSLGLAVDASRPAEIARGVRRFLSDSSAGFVEDTARKWALTQTPAAFAQAILGNLYPQPN